MAIDTDQVVLRPADAARLPTTASQIIGTELAAHHVQARRTSLLNVDDGLRLAVCQVDPLACHLIRPSDALPPMAHFAQPDRW